MTKLDEIQEHIDAVRAEHILAPCDESFIAILTALTDELKRIDAEQKPRSWECGCGAVNGINLPVCSVCGRQRTA